MQVFAVRGGFRYVKHVKTILRRSGFVACHRCRSSVTLLFVVSHDADSRRALKLRKKS